MSEHREQAKVIAWAKAHARVWPELALLHAIPNGGKRSRVTAARLKAEGVKPGVPDLHLPVAKCGFTSLYVEMKDERVVAGKRGPRRKRTYPTAKQRAWHRWLRAYGNAVEVCWTAEQAQDTIKRYLEQHDPSKPAQP